MKSRSDTTIGTKKPHESLLGHLPRKGQDRAVDELGLVALIGGEEGVNLWGGSESVGLAVGLGLAAGTGTGTAPGRRLGRCL